MAAIGSMRKKLAGFSEEGDDDYGTGGMYFNPSMFPPHRPDKEVLYFFFSHVHVQDRELKSVKQGTSRNNYPICTPHFQLY